MGVARGNRRAWEEAGTQAWDCSAAATTVHTCNNGQCVKGIILHVVYGIVYRLNLVIVRP